MDYWMDIIHRPVLKRTFRKLGLFPSSGEGVGDTYSVGSVKKG
jgi:hypothetical protein